MIKLIINNFSVSFQQARLKNNHTFKKLDLSLWKITLFLTFLRIILCVKNYDKICHNNNHKNHLLEIQFDVSGIHSSVLPLHAPAKYYRESASAIIRRCCKQITIRLTIDHLEKYNPLQCNPPSRFCNILYSRESAPAGGMLYKRQSGSRKTVQKPYYDNEEKRLLNYM